MSFLEVVTKTFLSWRWWLKLFYLLITIFLDLGFSLQWWCFIFSLPKEWLRWWYYKPTEKSIFWHLVLRMILANTQTVKNLVPSLFSASALVFLLPFTLRIQRIQTLQIGCVVKPLISVGVYLTNSKIWVKICQFFAI